MDWLFTYADPNLDWNYAIITLLVRFIGVFVVMLVMQVALQLSAQVVRRIEGVSAKSAAAEQAPAPASLDMGLGESDELDPAVVAAIGLAIGLGSSAPPRIGVGGEASRWSTAGRLQQMVRRAR
jgi:hypothetical protein